MTIIPIKPADSRSAYSYLVIGKDRAVLIDSGGSMYAKQYAQDLKRLLNGRNLDAVLLTHCHDDHVGGAREVSSMYHCPVFAHAGDLRSIRQRGIDCDEMYPDEEFELGDDHSLQVIHTPGHSSGSVCFYDTKTGSLFSGDTIVKRNQYGRTTLPSGSSYELDQSIGKLKPLKLSKVYSGHGGELSDGEWWM